MRSKAFFKSNKFWLALLAAILAVSAAAAVFVYTRTPSGTVAVVTLDGQEVHRVDLSWVSEGYALSYTGKNGITNVVEVSPGAIRVREADCPDQICVRQGWIRTGVAPIVCLPNSLVIEIKNGGGDIDGVVK